MLLAKLKMRNIETFTLRFSLLHFSKIYVLLIVLIKLSDIFVDFQVIL